MMKKEHRKEKKHTLILEVGFDEMKSESTGRIFVFTIARTISWYFSESTTSGKESDEEDNFVMNSDKRNTRAV